MKKSKNSKLLTQEEAEQKIFNIICESHQEQIKGSDLETALTNHKQ